MNDVKSAAVIGGGAWGTALAIHLARTGCRVGHWVREADLVAWMAERHENPVHLPGVRIPDAVTATGVLEDALHGADFVVAVVPTQFARPVFRAMAAHLPPTVPVVLANKGIEEGTLALPIDIAEAEFPPGHPTAVISGPSYAEEFAHGRPTTVVVASTDRERARVIQGLLSGDTLRLYTNGDPVGVQLAGALKNVIALAAGAVDGLDAGHNALAAVVTRGLAEMTRLGLALGGRASTFSGLAGLGDLILTCTGGLSRNHAVGLALARGERLGDILARTRSVAEGIGTTRSARDLARREGVEMPIVEEVHRILFDGGRVDEAMTRLMRRPLTSEDDEPGTRRA